MIGLPARSASSPLGRANAAEAMALPWQPYALAQLAPSMRLKAINRPPASQTATLMRMFISRALASATWMTWLASASVSAMGWPPLVFLQHVVDGRLDVVPARQGGALER